uniref:Uncharacterized protein n=1 Tax=viral metagenome TaxID=1070528 RepID=A0A6H1Z9J7_9ZZZZ
MRKSKWYWLIIGRAQRGWTTEIQGGIEAHTQATWRGDQIANGHSKRLLIAIFRAFLDWNKKVKNLRAIPGPFNN